MKKFITLLLIATLLIPSFALAQTVETNETEYASKPDTITRAEFARIIVHMTRTAESAEPQATAFTDVPTEHWASGYVAALERAEIVRGDGYGYFRPDDTITFVESVVMLMRALNYQRMANAQGGFPIGYMIAAVSAGITADVGAVGMDSLLTRNIAWRMVNNALDARIAPYVAWGETIEYRFGDPWTPPHVSLLTTVWRGYDIYFDGENFIFPRAIAEAAGTITRAEMARIVVYLRNMGDRAAGISSTTLSTDIPHRLRAARYINVATLMHSVMPAHGITHYGVISGDYGRFRPNDLLLIEDAITMLMQTLGYSPMVRDAIDGETPLSYLDIAELVGLTEGLEFNVDEYVTPELLYELVNRALDIPLMARWTGLRPVEYIIMDGTDGNELMTARTEFWHNASVYFDGENFVQQEL